MKKVIIALAIIFGSLSLAYAQEPPAMMGGGYQYAAPFQKAPWAMGTPMGMGYGYQNRGAFGPMGGGGYGMGYGPGVPGAMFNPNFAPNPGNDYTLGPGVMMGQGMLQFGMGPGMIRGLGAMGYISSEKFQKFFDETRTIRKELNGLMFGYAELLRNPNYDAKERINLENKILQLRQQVYDKAPRYQWPF